MQIDGDGQAFLDVVRHLQHAVDRGGHAIHILIGGE
jgi:hypothetical protein